jgi:hypothetical protein
MNTQYQEKGYCIKVIHKPKRDNDIRIYFISREGDWVVLEEDDIMIWNDLEEAKSHLNEYIIDMENINTVSFDLCLINKTIIIEDFVESIKECD